MFLNRTNELADLETRYASQQAEFVVLWGRRRIGKTSLIWEFCQNKPNLFYFSERAPEAYQLNAFSQQIAALTSSTAEPVNSHSDWYAAFAQLAEIAKEQRIIVVIDEYPYLAESAPGISTALQKAWDLHLSKSNIFLVLTGSTISVLSRHVLDQSAPLYGRHTWNLELKPLLLYDLPDFLPKYTPTQLIETHAVLGGLPGHIRQFNDSRSVLNNVARQIVSVSGSLYGTARLMIFEELSNPGLNLKVLEVIAGGAHRPADIGRLAGIPDRAQLRRLLLELREVRLIETRQPLERDRGRQRQPGYFLADPYLRFWFRFIKPYAPLLEMREGEQLVLDEIRNQWAQMVAPMWEEIARTHLWRLSARRQFPFYLEDVGFWFSGKAQLDLVGINRRDHRVVFGEAKWRRKAATMQTLEQLRTQSKKWLGRDPDWDVTYVLFARDFGSALREEAEAEYDLFLYGPNDLL